jgi:hypothetical protein
MYEVVVETQGIMQLGWTTLQCRFTNEEGVGDSPDSYAIDGKRSKVGYEYHACYINAFGAVVR